MRIAVVMPVLDREYHVVQALNSLREQTYPKDKGNLLVMVADDGSEDRTHEAAEAALAASRLRYGILKNSARFGPARARNECIKAAWDFVDAFALLDSDDLARPEWLGALAAPMGADPKRVGLVYGDEDEINSVAGYGRRVFRAPHSEVASRHPGAFGGSYLVSKRFLDRDSLFREDLPVGETLELARRVAAVSAAIHVPRALVTTRILNDSLRTTVSPEIWGQCLGQGL